MSARSELQTSLAEHQAQLELIRAALSADPHNTELTQLETDLVTLVQLTKDSLLETQRTEQLAQVDQIENGNTDQIVAEATTDEESSLVEELARLEGMKVTAPIHSRYGGKQSGNAIIVGVEGQGGGGEVGEYEDIRVRVAFSHPTENRLVVCKYYLEGRCTRGEGGNCKWSHGELVRLGELGAWRDVDYSAVGEGSQVLVRGEGGVWERGCVEEICEGEFLVKLDKAGSEPCAKTIEDIFPLEIENLDNVVDVTASDLDDSREENFGPTDLGCSGVKFGDWECYTRGMGSNMMVKMGWVVGQGLGRQGEGRVEPVSARVYPVGKSLDWCMERREQLGGGGVLDVENILKKEAKEAERKSKKKYEEEERRDNSAKSLFDFINIRLGAPDNVNKSLTSKNGFSNNKNKTEKLKEEPNKNLKIRQFQTGEQIAKVQKEISRLKESYSRHKDKDLKTAAGIKNKMEQKISELKGLETRDRGLKLEEGNRKSKSKLTIF